MRARAPAPNQRARGGWGARPAGDPRTMLRRGPWMPRLCSAHTAADDDRCSRAAPPRRRPRHRKSAPPGVHTVSGCERSASLSRPRPATAWRVERPPQRGRDRPQAPGRSPTSRAHDEPPDRAPRTAGAPARKQPPKRSEPPRHQQPAPRAPARPGQTRGPRASPAVSRGSHGRAPADKRAKTTTTALAPGRGALDDAPAPARTSPAAGSPPPTRPAPCERENRRSRAHNTRTKPRTRRRPPPSRPAPTPRQGFRRTRHGRSEPPAVAHTARW